MLTMDVFPPMINDSFEGYNETFNSTQTNVTRHSHPLRVYFPIIGSAMAASVVCLILTIVIYAKLSEFKNVPGKILMSLAICLIMNYCLLFIDLIFGRSLPFQLCRGIGIVLHVIFVAYFFWTGVMAFDIWRTVSSTSPAQGLHVKFWKYSLFAWLGSLVFALPAVIVDVGGLLLPPYAPSFGKMRCWFIEAQPILIYFTGPVAMILVINLIFFILTARTIRNTENNSAILQSKVSRQRFNLYLKLFLVNGLIWATEFIPTITRVYQLFALAGLLSSLQGVFIFLIFVCKRRIWRQVKEKYISCSSSNQLGLNHKQSLSSAVSRITLSTSASNLSQHRV